VWVREFINGWAGAPWRVNAHATCWREWHPWGLGVPTYRIRGCPEHSCSCLHVTFRFALLDRASSSITVISVKSSSAHTALEYPCTSLRIWPHRAFHASRGFVRVAIECTCDRVASGWTAALSHVHRWAAEVDAADEGTASGQRVTSHDPAAISALALPRSARCLTTHLGTEGLFQRVVRGWLRGSARHNTKQQHSAWPRLCGQPCITTGSPQLGFSHRQATAVDSTRMHPCAQSRPATPAARRRARRWLS